LIAGGTGFSQTAASEEDFMLARIPLFVALVLIATPVIAEEIACDGVFGIESSEALLIETYGADNVETGIVPGPEGTEMLATTVFPNDSRKRLQFVWWNEQELKDPSHIELGSKMIAPGGVRAGQTVDEVVALNGEAFTLSGFGWDYGGYASPESGALSDLPGGCIISIAFDATQSTDLDTRAIIGDIVVSSDEPLLEAVGAKVYLVSVGYPHYDFRD
jgi:hypothetical protein